jgi:hypothetical protein
MADIIGVRYKSKVDSRLVQVASRLQRLTVMAVTSATAFKPVIPVTEVTLARVPRALEGEVRGVVASRGRVTGGCSVKVAVRR